jgi:hypothetical protein
MIAKLRGDEVIIFLYAERLLPPVFRIATSAPWNENRPHAAPFRIFGLAFGGETPEYLHKPIVCRSISKRAFKRPTHPSAANMGCKGELLLRGF